MAKIVKILAFDTSSIACSVALLDTAKQPGEQINSLHKILPRQQGRLILPTIQAILQSSDLTLSHLDAIAYGCGPGSFTGIRIASTVAQGLGYAANLPVIPISSLAVLAQAAYLKHQATHFLVAVDAQIGEVYWARYAINQAGIAELRGQEGLFKPNEIPMVSKRDENEIEYGAGDGWAVYGEGLMAKLGYQPPILQDIAQPDARAMLSLASEKFSNKTWVEAKEALPVYLR